jgi:hypothetical protein
MENQVDNKKFECVVSAYKKLNTKIKGVEFNVISTLEELDKEGIDMHNAVYAWRNKILENEYLILSVQGSNYEDRANFGLQINKKEFVFDKLKGRKNEKATSEIINATIEFCKENNIEMSEDGEFDLLIEKEQIEALIKLKNSRK